MAVYTYEALKSDYTRKWTGMVISPARLAAITKEADKVIAGRDVYTRLQNVTNIPWYFIGILHLRESSCNFNRHLHNGDPLSGRTYHVPAGRPVKGNPPFTFEESAIDALTMMGYTSIKDWSIEQIAFSSEKFNGFGYRMHGVPSAYLWAGTNQYISGKYVSDGVFDASVVDVQQGCMAILKTILTKTQEKVAEPTPEVIAIEAPKAVIPEPTDKEMAVVSRKFWWTNWVQWLAGIFGVATASASLLGSFNFDLLQPYVPVILQFLKDNNVAVLLTACITIFFKETLMKLFMKQDVIENKVAPPKPVAPNVPEEQPLEVLTGVLPMIFRLFGVKI